MKLFSNQTRLPLAVLGFLDAAYGVLNSVFRNIGRMLLLSVDDFDAVVDIDSRDDDEATAGRVLVGAVDNRFVEVAIELFGLFGGATFETFEGVPYDVTGRAFVGVGVVKLTTGIFSLSEIDLRTFTVAVEALPVLGEGFLCGLDGVFPNDGMRDLRAAVTLLFCSIGRV